MRAFVVEDDPGVRDIIASLLETCGWTVHLAEDGIAALGGMHRAAPDLIVLDLLMPHLGGSEVLRSLRSSEFGRRIPVIVVTGASVDEEVRGLASAVLVKPFELAVLMDLSRSLTVAPTVGRA